MKSLSAELRSLLFVQSPATHEPASSAASSEAAEPASGAPAISAQPDTSGMMQAEVNVLPLLRAVASKLWSRAQTEAASRREQRERFLELLTWLLGKHGYNAVRPARQDYFDRGRLVEGRLALLLQRHSQLLAIELCLEPSLACAYKLLAAKKNGALSVMLCGYAPTPVEAHATLGRLAKKPTDRWFPVICLLRSK